MFSGRVERSSGFYDSFTYNGENVDGSCTFTFVSILFILACDVWTESGNSLWSFQTYWTILDGTGQLPPIYNGKFFMTLLTPLFFNQ